MTRRRLLTAVAMAVAPLLTLAVGLLAMPRPPALSDRVTGDATLAAAVRDDLLAAGQRHHAVVVSIDGDRTRFAGFGVDEHAPFEIGSATKTMTGLLFQDAIERGEVSADDRLEVCLPELAGSAIGAVRLDDLATHLSGVPRLLSDPAFQGDTLVRTLRGKNPYVITADEMIALARTEQVGERGVFEYSNLGTALLGQAVARCAGMDYPTLLTTRLFEPLGMTESTLPLTADELRPIDTRGYSARGVVQDQWAIGGHAPAGGVRSTAHDMTLFLRALLEGTAPGASAMDPRHETSSGPIGWFWFTLDVDGTPITFHNGATGGFTSAMMLDRTNGRAGLVLDDTAANVDAVAYAVLTKGAAR
ncbi:MAG: serine hydrolase [Microbacterium enclense]